MKRRGMAALALDGPPPVTLGLRRFMLRSVGPPPARFHPLDLDLVTADGAVARRALCVLTNTGGKSTLLKLLSAVVNPGAAGLIGRGEAAEMVLATDTSHVILEWQQADGARYVTGWLAQWDGLQKSVGSTKGFRQCWYFFRVNGFGVDDLPFEYDGRKVRWEEYRRQLRALFAEHPGATGYIADTQSDWSRVLVERTWIDAELFRYQATMNAAESGAAALVTRLKTPEAVVGFFVAAFDDDALTATLFREVAAYTTQAANRATMEAHASLCSELVEALQAFADENGNYEAALDMERLDTQHRRELAGAVRARALVERARAAEAAEALAAESERLVATNRAIDGDEARRKQYLYLEAEMRRETAMAAEAEAETAENAADLLRSAWSVVPAVQAHDSALAVNRSAQAAFDAAEHELAPLRAQVSAAASRLVAGLQDRASRAGAEAVAAKQRRYRAKDEASEAGRRREEALKGAAGLRQELKAADDRSARAAQLLTEARQRGDIGPGETAAQASERWLSVQDEATERRRVALADKGRAADARQEAMLDRSSAEIAAQKARTEVGAAATALADAASSGNRLSEHPDVASVIGVAPDDAPAHRAVPAAVAAEAASVIDLQADGVERSARDTWADLSLAEAELGRLGGTDLLDAGVDVVGAVGVLKEAHIGALTGWEWIAGAVASENRLAFVAARPDIANGVVVTDGSRLDDARKTLEKAGLFPRLAVVVATSELADTTSDDLPLDETETGRFVVEPHPGLYDKEKAEEEIARLEERRSMLTDRHADQSGRARELREAAGLARRHAEEWPEPKLTVIEARQAEAEMAGVKAAERLAQATTALRAAVQADQEATAAELAAGEAQSTASAVRLRLVGIVEAESAAASHAAARPGMVEQIGRLDSTAQAAAEVAAAAAVAAELAGGEQNESERVARDSKERAAQIGAPAAAEVPDQVVHVLEAEYAEAGRRFADEAAGRDHHEALKRTEEALAITAERLTGIDEPVLDRARHLAASVLAGTPDAVRSQIAVTEGAWKTAIDRWSQCRRDRERWEAEAANHRPPADRTVHATLTPEELPADADDAARRIIEVEARQVVARALYARQAASRDTAQRTKDQADEAATAFALLMSEEDDPVGGADAYEGDVDAAKADLDQRRKAVGYAKELVNEARVARVNATREVNNRANNKRWAEITDSLKELCVNASAEALAEHGGRYLGELRTREVSLRTDIAELDTHRSAVIDSLGQTCDRLKRNLQHVKGASTIPTKVQNVGGHQAIVIDFSRLPAEVANHGLSELVDKWAASGAAVPDAKARLSRLMDALSATVENRPVVGRWNVKLLKPRIDGEVTYCKPDRLDKEYSGGQELTLAVLLYCTLAAVRSGDRTGSDRPPGLLLLDNPFGSASNEKLIEMWQKLAEEADVQVLCFTALGEPSVLNGFNGPGTFRQILRNDRDQRNGHMHVRAVAADPGVQRLVKEHLSGPELEAEEESRVSGLGYETKPPFPVQAPQPGHGLPVEPDQ